MATSMTKEELAKVRAAGGKRLYKLRQGVAANKLHSIDEALFMGQDTSGNAMNL